MRSHEKRRAKLALADEDCQYDGVDDEARSLRKNYCGTVEIQWSPHPGRAGLSGYLVCMVHLVSLFQPHKPDRPNRTNEQDKLADFFSILLE